MVVEKDKEVVEEEEVVVEEEEERSTYQSMTLIYSPTAHTRITQLSS